MKAGTVAASRWAVGFWQSDYIDIGRQGDEHADDDKGPHRHEQHSPAATAGPAEK